MKDIEVMLREATDNSLVRAEKHIRVVWVCATECQSLNALRYDLNRIICYVYTLIR